MVAGLQAENARLEQRLSDITSERDKLREKIESLPVETPRVIPVTSKPKANSIITNQALIAEGDPMNHIRNLLAMALKNEPIVPPPGIVTPLSTLPKIEKVEVLTINPPEIEIEREETPKISSRLSAKSKDRGGR